MYARFGCFWDATGWSPASGILAFLPNRVPRGHFIVWMNYHLDSKDGEGQR